MLNRRGDVTQLIHLFVPSRGTTNLRPAILPYNTPLRDVASHLNTGGDTSSYKYLRNKVKYLKQHELLVTLQLDEIHIKPKMTYQNGKLIGNSGNNITRQSNRIQTLTYPNFSDNDLIMHASFRNLITIYHMEKESILKEGFQLTWKSLFPNSIERQNVKLALKVFDRTTVAALEILGPQTDALDNWKGTASFINIIVKFWNIVNVKNTTKGLHK